MPVYRFHIDVPAPPDVVAERVRVAVAARPTRGQILKAPLKGPLVPGVPFLGRVEGQSFRVRRNVQYRSPVPMIRGRIVPTATGSRVKVFVFMHPLTLAVAVAWMVLRLFVAAIAQSFLILTIVILGLILTVGLFFYEVLKVMPLLSEVVFNPNIAAVPRLATSWHCTTVTSSSWKRTALILSTSVAGVVLVSGAVGLFEYVRYLRSSPVYPAALELASQSAAAKAALGEPITAGLFTGGMLRADSDVGYAALTIPVSGPTSHGTLYIVANRIGSGGWDMERAVLYPGGPGTPGPIDLAPARRPETFAYPASGGVYLLPLDDRAASDVKELPSYYRSRLGLDVSVLPIYNLAADTIDTTRKQVIAEKALDSVERSHPEITDDLDSVILAVTSQDLSIQTIDWLWATSYRHGRVGVMSTARLHGLPWYAGANPAVYPVRVRKMMTKNLALLRYPVGQSADVTSALAALVSSGADLDEMSERFGGESGMTRGLELGPPCLTITQGPGRKQSWRIDCVGDPPLDNRFETFVTYPGMPLFAASHTDFPIGGQPATSLVRKYRSGDDGARAFGVGAAHSLDIFPVGDSVTFAQIELVLADGGRVPYWRTSEGTSYVDAKLRAPAYMGSPFSQSTLEGKRDGWDLRTLDGLTYRFPLSGSGRSWQQSALVGIRSGSGQALTIQRSEAGDFRQVQMSDGTAVVVTMDDMRRITSATSTTGHTIRYEYDAAGRLRHVDDSERGDEFFEYDSANRMTSVLDREGHPLLINTYGGYGEVRSQTLADGRRLLYECGYLANRQLGYLKLTLPDGHTIEWKLTRDGYLRSWPQQPQ